MPPEADPERDGPTSNGPSTPKLIKYRNQTGINTPHHLVISDPPRPGPNVGIYARVIAEEKKATYQYWLMSSVINVSFLGQITVAASLTALGASGASHIAITILGSINTVIAGVQTYLKGQGLPNRLRQYQFGLRKLREHMEDRERDFSHEDCKLNVDTVITDIAAMYQAVRQTAEDNTPDTYLPMEGAGKKLLGQKSITSTGGIGRLKGEARGGGSSSTKIDATEDVEGEVTKTAENEEAAKAKTTNGSSEAVEASSTPNHEDETEETPLLHERKTGS
ncbi:MAG: hypothetical protein Q9164_003003 [Protoblastenia rupestris]